MLVEPLELQDSKNTVSRTPDLVEQNPRKAYSRSASQKINRLYGTGRFVTLFKEPTADPCFQPDISNPTTLLSCFHQIFRSEL
jgi:hypothetical protein